MHSMVDIGTFETTSLPLITVILPLAVLPEPHGEERTHERSFMGGEEGERESARGLHDDAPLSPYPGQSSIKMRR